MNSRWATRTRNPHRRRSRSGLGRRGPRLRGRELGMDRWYSGWQWGLRSLRRPVAPSVRGLLALGHLDPQTALGGALEQAIGKKAFAEDPDPLVEFARRDPPRWAGRREYPLNGGRHHVRGGAVLFISLHQAYGLLDGRSVGVVDARHIAARRGEAGPDVPRLDEGYLDAERRHFVGKRLAITL